MRAAPLSQAPPLPVWDRASLNSRAAQTVSRHGSISVEA